MTKNKIVYLTIGLLCFGTVFCYVVNKHQSLKVQLKDKVGSIANDVLNSKNLKTYKDPTGTYSVSYPDSFEEGLFPYAHSQYFALTYKDTSKQPETKIGSVNFTSISIYLLDQTGTGEIDKSIKQIADEALSDEYKVPAFNDEVSKLSTITIASKNGYVFTTKKGDQKTEETYLDLGKVVNINPGKSKTMYISVQYRGQNDFVEKSKSLVREVLNTLKIN